MVSIILPTYNERGNIVRLINGILKITKAFNYNNEIVVVDDDSPDSTGYYVKEIFKNNSNIKVIIRKDQKGLASAIRTGIMNSSGEKIVVMDTDFNHEPKLIPQLLEFLKFYDLIIGSRFTIGGNMDNKFRYYCSYIYNLMIRVVLHTQIQDNLSGFFSVRREKLMRLDFDKIFWGYGDYFFRLLFYAEKLNFSMLAIPVIYKQRKYGQSKTNFFSTLLNYTREIILLRLKRWQDW